MKLVSSALLALLSLPLSAQNTTHPAARFINLTPFERHEWATATVPFAQGVWQPGDTFRAVGVHSELVPFGARWDDGSVRFARMTARLHLLPGEDVTVPVQRIQTPQQPLPFALGPWTLANLADFGFEILVDGPNGSFAAPMVIHSIVADSSTRKTVLFRSRIPNTDLIYDMWITFFSGQDHARFELRVTNSNPASPAWRSDPFQFGLRMTGAAPFIRHSTYHDVVQISVDPNGENVVMLGTNPTYLYDGQALEWYGTLFFADQAVPVGDAAIRVSSFLAAHTQEFHGVATNWPASRAFGPFGVVPEMPPWWTDGGVAATVAERREFLARVSQRSDRWSDRLLGLQPNAAAPGDQYDYGASQLGDIVRTTLPHRIAEVRFGVGEEAFRPCHYRELNGNIVRSANHPGWISWSGRCHYDSRICPDRLGKPYPAPWVSNNAHRWTGKDNQHWSSLALASTYLLTTSDSLRMEIENDIELFLSSHTLPSFSNAPMNNLGPPRAVGRPMLTMAWHYVCTGRQDLRDRIRGRVEECVLPQYFGTTVAGPVKPLQLSPRTSGMVLQFDYWSPWGDGIAAVGLEAAARVTGSTIAEGLAELCSHSLTWNGWKLDPNDFRIGYIIGFQPNGAGLTASQLQDPAYVNWASSGGLRLWCMPAAKIALNRAQARNDQPTINQATTILNLLRANRAPQTTGRWDRYANWSGI